MTGAGPGHEVGQGAVVPAELAARVARDLTSAPRARIGERESAVRLLAALLGAQAGAAGVSMAMGVRAAGELVLVLPVLAASAVLTAGALALGREAVPGRGVALRVWAIGMALGGVSYLALTFAQARWMAEGIGRAGTNTCVAIGAALGLVPLVVGLALIRRGYAVRPRVAGFVLGVFAGLVGLTTLHLHCSDVSWSHTGVVHGAVLVVLGGAGALGGRAGLRIRG